MKSFSVRSFPAGCASAGYRDNAGFVSLDEKALQRMAVIGLKAAGLSHQLSNRFTSMLVFAEFLERDMARCRGSVLSGRDLDEALTRLQKITAGIRQSGQILKGLLDRAVKEEDVSAVNVRELVGSALEAVQFKMSAGRVVVELCFDDDLPKIRGNFIQLQEAFVNIIDNSFYSMMKKEASLGSSYRPAIRITAVCRGKRIVLVIEDNGEGIASESMSKLFTPFFSSKKSVNEGHGIGLFVVKHIIENLHCGKISYSSDFGRWVRVRIELACFKK